MSDEQPPTSDQPGHEAGEQAGQPSSHDVAPVVEPTVAEPTEAVPVAEHVEPADRTEAVATADQHAPATEAAPVAEHVEPAESVWDPWAPPRADNQAPVDQTHPVDLSHTQKILGAPAPEAGAGSPAATPLGASGAAAPAQGAPQAPVWASEPTGWPQHDEHGSLPATHSTASAPAAAATPMTPAPPGAGWDPITAASADAGYRSHDGQWVGGQPVASSAPQQKGPGWGALVAVAAISALLAAALGGMFGGWLGATDRIGFGNLDRTGTSIPSVGAGATARPEGSIANIAAKALPSVVTIKVKGADGAGTGSGFVLDRDGHIVTNNHVVASAADGGTIAVELSNGAEIKATIVGRDSSYDLAVLKTDRTDLVPLVIGSSKDVVVGDQVIAVGAPLGLESSVTSGIVSALNRPVSPGGDSDQQSFINAIQTDAAINPGNSGGPLLDMQGHVIGINSAIARIPGAGDTQSGNIGVGFSIPSDQVAKTAAQLIKTGKAEHPIIGVVLDRQYTGSGVKILESGSGSQGEPVSKGGPADKAGIKPGDIIVEFDGRPVSDADDLVVAIRAKSVGDAVPMKVKRGNETISVTVTLSGTSGS